MALALTCTFFTERSVQTVAVSLPQTMRSLIDWIVTCYIYINELKPKMRTILHSFAAFCRMMHKPNLMHSSATQWQISDSKKNVLRISTNDPEVLPNRKKIVVLRSQNRTRDLSITMKLLQSNVINQLHQAEGCTLKDALVF